jgi:8-oxo-dGTP pyrophosphatase MutT (NUDIX family)
VYRLKNNQPEFFVVTGRTNRDHWILPRGHIEGDETPEETALRELKEETGLEGRIAATLGSVRYAQQDEPVRIKFFLVERIGGNEETAPEGRQWRWCSFKEALALVSFHNYRAQLQIAFRRLNDISEPRP